MNMPLKGLSCFGDLSNVINNDGFNIAIYFIKFKIKSDKTVTANSFVKSC